MIGDKFKTIRKEKGLSQQQLADLLSTSASYISEIEKGKKQPGSGLLASLKRQLGVSIDWLLSDDAENLALGESAAAYGNEPNLLNLPLLTSVIDAVERALQETKRKMAPDKKAELVGAIYEIYVNTDQEVNRGQVLRLVKSAA